MKPDWKDAPEWANYLAMDEDQLWYWYEYCPTKTKSGNWAPTKGKYTMNSEQVHWMSSLEQRQK